MLRDGDDRKIFAVEGVICYGMGLSLVGREVRANHYETQFVLIRRIQQRMAFRGIAFLWITLVLAGRYSMFSTV